MLSARPKVAELSFRLFSRTLHPELFEVYRSRTIERDRYQAKIDITSSGHVITWRAGTAILSEVATSSHQPLPQRRELFVHALRGAKHEEIEVRGGATYRTKFQLESASEDLFYGIQQQLHAVDSPDALLHSFDSSGRACFGAISLISVEARMRSFRIRAIHTFPDDGAVVKIESVFTTTA